LSWPSNEWPDTKTRTPAGGERNATFSVDRDTGGTTSVGRKRLIEMSADKDVYDERLWMSRQPHRRGGQLHGVVGTPEQVAEAMLAYYDLGISACCSRDSTRSPTPLTLAHDTSSRA